MNKLMLKSIKLGKEYAYTYKNAEGKERIIEAYVNADEGQTLVEFWLMNSHDSIIKHLLGTVKCAENNIENFICRMIERCLNTENQKKIIDVVEDIDALVESYMGIMQPGINRLIDIVNITTETREIM